MSFGATPESKQRFLKSYNPFRDQNDIVVSSWTMSFEVKDLAKT